MKQHGENQNQNTHSLFSCPNRPLGQLVAYKDTVLFCTSFHHVKPPLSCTAEISLKKKKKKKNP